MASRKPQIQATEAATPQVDQGRRAFLRGAVALAGIVGLKAAGCAVGESVQGGRSCSSSELPTNYSYRNADSVRALVWNNSPIELDGIYFYINNIRKDGTVTKADVDPKIPELGCGRAIGSPLPLQVPSIGAMTIRGRGYYVTINNATVNEGDPPQSWADVEVRRFYTYCEYGMVRRTLTAGENEDTIASSDGKFSLKLLGVEEGGRAIFAISDSEGQDKGVLTLREGEVKFGQVGDKIYPITAHVVVAGNEELASCADISISSCSMPPHETGVDFHW